MDCGLGEKWVKFINNSIKLNLLQNNQPPAQPIFLLLLQFFSNFTYFDNLCANVRTDDIFTIIYLKHFSKQ